MGEGDDVEPLSSFEVPMLDCEFLFLDDHFSNRQDISQN